MQNSKLFALFSALNGFERANLRKFISSPFHNSNSSILSLFEFLSKEIRQQRESISPQKAWAAVFPQQTYQDAKMRLLMNQFSQLIEQFLIQNELQNDANQQFNYLNQALKRRNLQIQTNQNLQNWQRYQEENKLQNSNFFHQNYQYEQQFYHQNESKPRDTRHSFQKWIDSLDIVFIVEKLRQACTLTAHQWVYKIDYQWYFLPEILTFLRTYPAVYQQNALIGAYYFYYLSISNPLPQSDEYFNEYKQILSRSVGLFEPQEAKNLYLLAINYAIKRANKGYNQAYMLDLLELYKAGFEANILVEQGQISRFAFKNVVSLSLRLADFDWAARFIGSYGEKIAAAYKLTYQNYAWAKWHFAKENYEIALEFLQKVDYEDIFLNLDAKMTQLKIYAALREYELLESFLQTFKTFLVRKKKLLSYHYQNYQNILSVSLKIIKINPHDRAEKLQLHEKIQTIEPLTEREWLLDFCQKR